MVAEQKRELSLIGWLRRRRKSTAAGVHRVHRVPWVPLAVVVAVVAAAIFAGLVAPHSPTQVTLAMRLHPPFWQEGGSLSYPLGTDALGRDVLSRLIYGARISLMVGVVVTLISGAIGLVLGLLAGYFRGIWEGLIARAIDATLALPVILLALVLAVALGPSLFNVIVAVSVVLWARFARVAYAEALSWRSRDFVSLAKTAGCSSWRIAGVHILPNMLNTMIVFASLQIGHVILVEATLSFLGAGVPPEIPTWGAMVAEGRPYVVSAWWVPMLPGLTIFITVLALNLLGDWLRDKLDPKLRQL